MSGGRSFFERVLGHDGDLLLRIAVILLAALVAGAAIQRVLVGQYGGIKVGSLEIAELASASDGAVKELQDALAKLQGEAQSAIKKLSADLATTQADSLEREVALNQTLSVITKHLATIGDKPKGEVP